MRRGMAILAFAALVVPLGVCPAQAQDGPAKKPGTVLTFYGLLKLEQDPKVSDEEKLQEWQAFIERASEQAAYAKKAVDRWKNAAKVRLVEGAKAADADPKLPTRDKIDKWQQVARLYPRSTEGRTAKRRVTHWRRMETKRLVAEAERVERTRRPKVERIRAWGEVLDWVSRGPEANAATRRLRDLQNQLFTEAQSVDRIARVDKRTKLEAWRDVLGGRPTSAQKQRAEARVAELEAELIQETSMRRSEGPAATGAN